MLEPGGLSGLSAAALSVWGKSPTEVDGPPLALAQHLVDSADVAAFVWDWLPDSVQSSIEAALPEDARDGRTLLRWLAGIHDIGKCSPPFAVKQPDLYARMAEHGLLAAPVRTDFEKALHGVVGHVVLAQWLTERFGSDDEAATSYAVVVGGHHGVPPDATAIRRVRRQSDLRGTGRWAEVQVELLDAVASYTGAAALLPRWSQVAIPATVQAVLTGAVIVCDWLASDSDRFPFGREPQEQRAPRAWAEVGLPPPWRPPLPERDPAAQLAARFPTLAGHRPRPVQRLTVEAAWSVDGPALLLVEAAMGTGKTEAALLAAEVLAARFGCGGIYLALPTMATADAMFGRGQDWIGHLGGGGVTSTYLAHSKHDLNDRFRGLTGQRHAAGVHDDDERREDLVEARVLSWLSGRKKGVLATMVVGTIDQLLFAALQARHLALRHLAFAGKVVVVDEAHAADDYMRTYLCRALEWLAAYGVPVVVLSATLPWSQRQELADAYRAGLGLLPSAVPPDAPYPALTAVSAQGVEVTSDATAQVDTTLVAVRCLDDDADTLSSLLSEQLVDGGCAAVLRNTVSRAQQIAEHLRETLVDTEVVLVHSRFVATHRAAKEADLRARLGPGADGRPQRLVVVGTQVLEQSLDLDFDLMVSDLAPIDLLLQRTGRLHRHRRGPNESERPPGLRQPQFFVTGVEEWRADGLPEPVSGSRYVYDLSRLYRAAAALGLSEHGTRTLRLPDEIRPLVEAAYAEAVPGTPAMADAIEEADTAHRAAMDQQRAEADQFRIAAPRDLEDDNLLNWLGYGSGSEADSDDPRDAGASRVRDSIDGIEVLVVQRKADGEVVVLDDGLTPYSGNPAVPFHLAPVPDLARAIAAMTIRLPLSMTQGKAFDDTLAALERQVHDVWQDSRWLKGQLALHLDDDWKARVGDIELTYDPWLGLVDRKAES